jgi:hypothetical protein
MLLQAPDLTSLYPVFNVRWTLLLDEQVFFMSTGKSNFHNYQDTLFPVCGKIAPGYVPKCTPLGDWPSALLQHHCVGKNLTFDFKRGLSVFVGSGWTQVSYGQKTSMIDQISCRYQNEIAARSNYCVGAISDCTTDKFQLVRVSMTVPCDFLPLTFNKGDITDGGTVFEFPQRITNWQRVKKFDLCGESKTSIMTQTMEKEIGSICWFSYLPFLSKFSSWSTVQQSACFGGNVWISKKMSPLRDFVLCYDFDGVIYRRRKLPLSPCNIWQIRRVQALMH